MKFISEEIIEATIDKFELDENAFFDFREKLINTQLAISSVLTEENLDVLEDDEYDLLWFMVTVIYGSIISLNDDLPLIAPKAYESAEETNWNTWNHSKGKNFRDKLNDFFEGFEQEDLLAFIEDSLEPDEDVDISPTGREVIFITCKSIVDSFELALK